MRLKNIWKLFPLVLIAGTIFYFERKSFTEKNRLKDAALSNVVVKIKSNWSGGRSYDYITDNNYTITLLNNDTLQVGDSIVKKANTSNFKVYRKTKGVYSFYKSFNINVGFP